ncbi:HBL/NHE enterotoxin family protein [Bacillus thuringiensis]|uniref:HBL/NHE enterotoxin family protein n=1 Tax=Bacillus thuringiensis TaxID=1428 RepID=UPI003BF675C4
MKKKVLTGTMIAALLATSVPFNVLADQVKPGETQQVQQVSTQGLESKLSLSISDLGAQSILAKTYALSLQKQADLTIPELPDLTKYQQTARQNAKALLDTIYPQFIDANQQIIQFSNQFASKYAILFDLAGKAKTDATAKQQFVEQVQQLQETIATYKENADKMKQNTAKFQTAVGIDITNFTKEAQKATDLLTSKDGEIAKLTSQIATINTDIQSQLNTIITTSVTMALSTLGLALGLVVGITALPAAPTVAQVIGVVTPVVTGLGGMVGSASGLGIAVQKMTEKRNELATVTQNLSKAQTSAAGLTLLKGQVNNFIQTIETGKASFDHVQQGWTDLEQNFTDIQTSLQAVDTDEQKVLNKLSQLKQKVDRLEKDATQQEKILADVKYAEK